MGSLDNLMSPEELLNDTPEIVYHSNNKYAYKTRIGRVIELRDEDTSLPVETIHTKAGYTKDSTFG